VEADSRCGLGAAASGLVETHNAKHANLFFALIPLVCIYVDLLCRDQTLRIVVIARYLYLKHEQKKDPTETEYEAFVHKAGDMPVGTFRESITGAIKRLREALIGKTAASAYALQAFAQDFSTVFLSVAVIVLVPGWINGQQSQVAR